MSQHDLTIDNQGFPAFRADLNNALQALGSTQSGTTAPSPAFANQLWYDTTNNQLKIRNEDNDAWISVVTLDQSADVTSGVGAKTLPTGDLVGTSDSQTLTNKTINASQLVDASVTPAKLSTNAQYTGFKNRIINGAMVVAQRTTASINVDNSAVQYPVDRFFCYGTQASSKFAVQQTGVTLDGFTTSIKATSSSAYSVTSSDNFYICQNIEGYNVADLNWGSASAKTVTLSFKVYSSLTGTFGGALLNDGYALSYPFSYSIPTANTWTTISVTIAGPTSGTWLTNNGVGIRAYFSLGTGSTGSSTAGSWQSGTYYSATGATSVVGTNGATFYITGVQLEVGSTATSFDYLDYGRSLIQCQRYYYKEPSTCTHTAILDGTADFPAAFVTHPVDMRTTPTTVFETLSTFYYNSGSAQASFTPSGGTTAYVGNLRLGASRKNSVANGQGSAQAQKVGQWEVQLSFSAEL